MEKPGAVVDTSVLISRLLRPLSVPGLAVDKFLLEYQLLLSADTLSELEDVAGRPKFERYATPLQRAQYVLEVRALAKFVEITTHICACRDPKDDNFLELAVSGEAAVVLSGDEDLLPMGSFKLSMGSFQGIPILRAAQFLAN